MMSEKNPLSPTEVRKNFSLYLDMAMRKPVSVKRREETFLTINLRQLADSVPFTPVYDENAEAQQPFVFFEELPQVIGHGHDKSEMIADFAYGLKDYATLYLQSFESHYYATDLKKQLLQVSILADMSIAEIGGFISAKLEGIRTVSDQ